jgi:hypothetical protein
MREAFSLIWTALAGVFRSRASLAAEILVLRHQINIQQRHSPKRQTFSATDRWIFAGLYRLAPTVLNALAIVKPETVIKWHRAGFRSYWHWKSRSRGGRPRIPPEIRNLIREMSIANPLWGAPRIHGELLKLGIDVGQTSVAKYTVVFRSTTPSIAPARCARGLHDDRPRRPPSYRASSACYGRAVARRLSQICAAFRAPRFRRLAVMPAMI